MTHDDSRLPGQPSADSTEVVRADLGGWISGPCLSGQPAGLMASNRLRQDPTRPCVPAVLGTVLAVADGYAMLVTADPQREQRKRGGHNR